MPFLPWHLTAAFVLDLLVGDPQGWPHPIRWIGRLISGAEGFLLDLDRSPFRQRVAGLIFWGAVMAVSVATALVVIRLAALIHPIAGNLVIVWMAYTTLAVRNLHDESRKVADALEKGDLVLARERLSWIVSRDTSHLEEKDIVRALVETVSESVSDGIVAPLFYLALGGPVAAIAYKAASTMDSMVGYQNDRYRWFGWFAAKADDVANWIPARLSGLFLAGAAASLDLDWRGALRIMKRDAPKMKSPNAGYPEAAAAGALGVQLGGTNVYFGCTVEKPVLGDAGRKLDLDVYRSAVRLMYGASVLAFAFAFAVRAVIAAFGI